MIPLLKLSRRTKIFISLLIFYIILTFLLPASDVTKTAYHLSNSEYYNLLFTVRLPIIAAWCLAFYSFTWLNRYAQKVKDTPEGEHFANIARGVKWVAWGFLIPALVTSLLNGIANHNHGFLSSALIIGGYIYTLVPIVAFSYMGKGSHALAIRAKVQLSTRQIRLLIAILVLFSVLFCYLVSRRLTGDGLSDSFNVYYLPNWLVWTTIVGPYLYAAFIGLFACFELILTARRTPGVIYKQGLELLASGLVLIIIGLSSLQYFRTIVPRTGHLVIGVTLITSYIIYATIGAGCILLVMGAKRLKRIEDA